MALMNCPECNGTVSDKATVCPHCGYPLNTPTRQKPRVKNGKAIKLPNGFGSIQKLSGKRRNPWRVRKTDGFVYDPKTGRAKQRYINIGYYPTREDAMLALSNYNQNPYDIKTNNYTFEEVYNMFLPEKMKAFENEHSARTLIMAFNHSPSLHKMKMQDIRPAHMEKEIENANMSNNSKQKIKAFYNAIFDYAEANGLVEKNYARMMYALGNGIKVETKKEEDKKPFTSEEIKKLWNSLDSLQFADIVLIQIYGGWRINELFKIKLDNINLDECYMVSGSKTDAGKNRKVPIHKDVVELVKKRIEHAKSLKSEYLFNDESSRTSVYLTADKFQKRFSKVMDALGMEHNSHDCRETFATRAKDAGINEYIKKRILGHKISDVTEAVYTKRYIAELKEAVDNIVFIE